jgi:hypothetical protein
LPTICPADHLPRTLDFTRHALVRCDDFVEGICDLAADAGLVARQSNREIAVANGLQRTQQFAKVELGIATVGFPVRGPRGTTHCAFLSRHQ